MTKKIRLISLATTYPDSEKSTKPKFVHLFNRELVNLGIDVLAICPKTKDSVSEEMEGVKVKRFGYFFQKFDQNTTSIPDKIKTKTGILKVLFMMMSFFWSTFFSCLKYKPDIVHGQWAFPGGYIAYLMSKIFSTKAIITVHYAEIPLLRKFNFIRKRVVNALNNCSKVIAVSNHTKKMLVELGVNEKNIIVIRSIPNFVSHTLDTNQLEKFREKFVPSDHKLILFCGRLVEHKGVNYLIESILKIKTENIHLIVVGGGIVQKELESLVDSLGIDDKVTFFGRASHEELGWLHDISDVFVCPSIIDDRGNTEGLGLVIPEAMESGLPVIASDVGGIPDIIQHEKNGLLVKPQNPKEISDAIDRLIQDESLKRKIIENSKKTVSEFQPSNIAKVHLEIFKKMIK